MSVSPWESNTLQIANKYLLSQLNLQTFSKEQVHPDARRSEAPEVARHLGQVPAACWAETLHATGRVKACMICSPPQPRRHMSCCHLHLPCDILCGQNQRQLLGKQENQGGVQSTNIPGKKAFSPQARSWLSMHSFFNLMPRHQNYPHNFCRTGRASRVTRMLRNSYERKMSCAYHMLTVDCRCATTVTGHMW